MRFGKSFEEKGGKDAAYMLCKDHLPGVGAVSTRNIRVHGIGDSRWLHVGDLEKRFALS
jgi:hypothetical protein